MSVEEEISKFQKIFISKIERKKRISLFLESPFTFQGMACLPPLLHVQNKDESKKKLLLIIHPDKINNHPFSESEKNKISNLLGIILNDNYSFFDSLNLIKKSISEESFNYILKKLKMSTETLIFSSLEIYYYLRRNIELIDENIDLMIKEKCAFIYLNVYVKKELSVDSICQKYSFLFNFLNNNLSCPNFMEELYIIFKDFINKMD